MRRLPAEWEPQRAVLMSFPRAAGDWGEVLHAASAAMIDAAESIRRVCPVTLVVGDKAHFADYAAGFSGTVIELSTDDCWIRDSGPITVFEPAPRLLDFTFNGWGGKFSAVNDDRLPQLLHPHLEGFAYEKIDLVLEGGSIESDGRGTIMTTERCLLADGRNDFADRSTAEAAIKKHLGAERVIWLEHGELEGDDTDAHVDTVARFLDATTIAYVGPPPTDDPQYDDFKALRDQLHTLTDYHLLELPWADGVVSRSDGHRLPASYANFLISNGTLFLPTYGLDSDAEAAEVLREHAVYTIVPVDCRAFVEQHGALHCLTMQIPQIP